MDHVLTVTLNAAVDTTLTIPSMEIGASYTAQDVVKLPGGKGLNVARTLRALGQPVQASGFIGGIPTPFVTGGLEAAGIAARFLEIAGTTRTCTAVVELDTNRVTEFNEPGPRVTADEAADFLNLFVELVADARVVALSGSLPPGLPDDYYTLLIERAHAAGVPVVLDTSGRALGPGLGAMPLLVKPNAKEAGALVGGPIDGGLHSLGAAIQAAAVLRDSGARAVALTLGAQGAVLMTASGAWWARGPAITPVSTVGSGDAFTGGLIVALCRAVDGGAAATIEDALGRDDVAVGALTLAMACGAANALTIGAGVLDPDTVTRLRDAVAVERLG